MPDYDSIQRRRNLVVGVFVISAVCIGGVMLFLFQDAPLFVTEWKSFNVSVWFPSAPGVNKNTPVRFAGYQVGMVTKVSPPRPHRNPDGITMHQVKVTMAIEKEYNEIPKDADIFVMKRGLGSSYIDITVKPEMITRLKDPKIKKDAFLEAGSEVYGKVSSASEFLPAETMDKIDRLIENTTELTAHINTIVGDPNNKKNIADTLANLRDAAAQAQAALDQVRKFSIAGMVAMETANTEIANVSKSVTEASDQLGHSLIEARRLIEKINYGDGTVSRLINDDRMYENLLDSTARLKEALEKLDEVMEKTKEKGIQLKVF